MNKKISLGAAIAFMAVVATITFCVTMLFSQDIFNKMIANVNQKQTMYTKIEEIYNKVNSNYLFEVDEETLLNAISTGMVDGLDDQYAKYYNEEEYEQKVKEDKGELVGIGVQVQYDNINSYLTIMEVYPDSPAESAGLKKGDMIVKIGDQDLSQVSSSEAVSLIKGEAGTKVSLVARRDGVDISVEMARKKMVVPSVQSRMIEKNGYIKISEFNEATVEQFKSAVEDLTAQGAESLIFDLRNNGGGTLDSVLDILDYLLPEGVLATSTNKLGETTVLGNSDASEIDMPMVTLTNANTASAAELFVQALKDYEKASSVGTTTYGKGVMQTTYQLSDGSAIKVTSAFFNPPKSENFNGVGIKPDYEVTLTKEQEEQFSNLDETNDPQLMKAISVINSQK